MQGQTILLVSLMSVVAGMRVGAAEQGSETPDLSEPLEEIVIVGRYEFLHSNTYGVTNLPLPIEKVPQAVNLVDADFIKAADLKDLADIAGYTPGAVNVGNSQGFGAFISLREFASANALDGINFGEVSGANYALDFAILDRLEVIQGPSSVVYGAATHNLECWRTGSWSRS